MKRKLILLTGLFLLVSSTAMAKSSILVFITDLYDQKSVKPQEPGSMTKFVSGTVTIDGKKFESTEQNLDWMEAESEEETATKNPIQATPKSVANGKLKYNTYCAVCHTDTMEMDDDGLADSKVNKKGMLAPAMLLMTPDLTDGYIYHKAKFGGAIMPPLGYATTEQDRWDIVNYIRTNLEKQQ